MEAVTLSLVTGGANNGFIRVRYASPDGARFYDNTFADYCEAMATAERLASAVGLTVVDRAARALERMEGAR